MAGAGWRRKVPGARVSNALLPGILLVSACGGGSSPEVTAEEGARVAQVADSAAVELLRTLLTRLTAAVEGDGTAAGARFCSMEAIPLTRLVEAGLDGGLELKRTSFRYRNLDNAPDEAEEMALRYFENAILEQGQAPARYVQRVSAEEFRYYKPLFVGEFCLRCHGPMDRIDGETRAWLEEEYPGDLATGYQPGDLRGVVRVSVPAAAVQD